MCVLSGCYTASRRVTVSKFYTEHVDEINERGRKEGWKIEFSALLFMATKIPSLFIVNQCG